MSSTKQYRDLAMQSNRVTGLADPASAQDAATKAYVDAAAAGARDVKDSARAASTGNLTLSGAQTIDGVAVIAGNRVLVKNQTTGAQNGLYVAAAGAWARATDADTDAEVTSGLFVFVEEGTANAGSGWLLTTANPITLGSTTLTFTQVSGLGQVVAGDGLSKTGNTLNVGVGTGLALDGSDAVKIDPTWPGQSAIITLGTISTGTWQGTAVAVGYGGTGAATAAAARTNLGAVGKYAVDFGDGAATTFVLTHNLGTRDVVVAFRLAASPYTAVECDWEATTTNTITVTAIPAPAASELRAIVVG